MQKRNNKKHSRNGYRDRKIDNYINWLIDTRGYVKYRDVLEKQVEAIAKEKMEDLNAGKIESAMRIIEGTARSMGIEVVD